MIRTRLPNTKYITLALCALLLSAPALHAAPFVYVADTVGFSVSVIDAATNNVVTTVSLGNNNAKDGIAISPDGTIAYVPCYNGGTDIGTIQRIDVATNTLLSQILLGSLIQPDSIAITPNGQFAYVTALDLSIGAPPQGEVLQINLTSNAITPIAPGTFTQPTQIVIASDPSGLTAYVLDVGTNVYPINLTDNSLHAAVTGSNTPAGIAVSPDGAYLYISQQGANHIQQYHIDGAHRLAPTTGATITYSSLPGAAFVPAALAITSDGNTLYVSSVGTPSAVGAINISNPAIPVSGTFLDVSLLLSGFAPSALAITPDNKTLYGTLNADATTIAVDITNRLTPTLTLPTITVGGRPAGLAITPMNLLPPASVSGCKTCNVFLLQTDLINNITWTAPTSGSPVSYNIYRDAPLTELIANVPASGTLQFYDHGRQPNVVYSYYITSVDSSGNQSTANSVTVMNPC
jgi:DNA-binding beta-propeller fold protein YncE